MKNKFKLIVPAVITIAFLLQLSGTGAEEEKPVFESMRCGICHKPDTGKANPSLIEIAKAYNKDAEKLMAYLGGETESIINKERSKIMSRYIEKTKALSKEDLKALAEYIINQAP